MTVNQHKMNYFNSALLHFVNMNIFMLKQNRRYKAFTFNLVLFYCCTDTFAKVKDVTAQ